MCAITAQTRAYTVWLCADTPFTTERMKQWLSGPVVSLQADDKMGPCGWSCQNHRTTGRKHSLTDGRQEWRRGRRSRWERHKAFHTDRERECAISQGAKPRGPAKARPRRAERGCLWFSYGETERVKMREWRGPGQRLRLMGNCSITKLSADRLLGKCLTATEHKFFWLSW